VLKTTDYTDVTATQMFQQIQPIVKAVFARGAVTEMLISRYLS